jgi:hypothetical protein
VHNPVTIRTFSKWLLYSFGVILSVTAVAKIWSSFGDSRILLQSDPIVRIQFRYLMFAFGSLELAVAFVCFFSNASRDAILLVAWLSTLLLLYRLGMWWLDWHSPCPCLGNLTDALHISPGVSSDLVKVFLAYLFIASYGLLLFRMHRNGPP